MECVLPFDTLLYQNKCPCDTIVSLINKTQNVTYYLIIAHKIELLAWSRSPDAEFVVDKSQLHSVRNNDLGTTFYLLKKDALHKTNLLPTAENKRNKFQLIVN